MQMPNSVCSCDPQLGRTQLYCSGQSNPLMQPLIGSSTQIFPRHAIFWQWRVIPSDPVEQSASASQCWYLFSRDKRFSYGKSTWGYATTKDSFDIQFVIHDSIITQLRSILPNDISYTCVLVDSHDIFCLNTNSQICIMNYHTIFSVLAISVISTGRY